MSSPLNGNEMLERNVSGATIARTLNGTGASSSSPLAENTTVQVQLRFIVDLPAVL
jgi:hypothetical protein